MECGEGGGVCRQAGGIGLRNAFFFMNQTMEGGLGNVCMWSANCGLGVSPTNKEMMLFATKSRLGVILDPK